MVIVSESRNIVWKDRLEIIKSASFILSRES